MLYTSFILIYLTRKREPPNVAPTVGKIGKIGRIRPKGPAQDVPHML